jgi:hypothetical protein
MVLLSLLIRKAFPYNDMFEYNLLKSSQLPTLEVGADDYLSHRVDAAANTLRAVSAVDPLQLALQRQASVASNQSQSHDWFGLHQLRRRFSREGSIRSSPPPAPTITVTPTDEDPDVPLQFLRARTSSIRHIQSLSMLLDHAGESGTDVPVHLGDGRLARSADNCNSASLKYRTQDGAPVTETRSVVAFEESPMGESLDSGTRGQEQAPVTAFRAAAISRHVTAETNIGGLEDLDESVFERSDTDMFPEGSVSPDEGDRSITPLTQTRHDTLRRDSTDPEYTDPDASTGSMNSFELKVDAI